MYMQYQSMVLLLVNIGWQWGVQYNIDCTINHAWLHVLIGLPRLACMCLPDKRHGHVCCSSISVPCEWATLYWDHIRELSPPWSFSHALQNISDDRLQLLSGKQGYYFFLPHYNYRALASDVTTVNQLLISAFLSYISVIFMSALCGS